MNCNIDLPLHPEKEILEKVAAARERAKKFARMFDVLDKPHFKNEFNINVSETLSKRVGNILLPKERKHVIELHNGMNCSVKMLAHSFECTTNQIKHIVSNQRFLSHLESIGEDTLRLLDTHIHQLLVYIHTNRLNRNSKTNKKNLNLKFIETIFQYTCYNEFWDRATTAGNLISKHKYDEHLSKNFMATTLFLTDPQIIDCEQKRLCNMLLIEGSMHEYIIRSTDKGGTLDIEGVELIANHFVTVFQANDVEVTMSWINQSIKNYHETLVKNDVPYTPKCIMFMARLNFI